DLRVAAANDLARSERGNDPLQVHGGRVYQGDLRGLFRGGGLQPVLAALLFNGRFRRVRLISASWKGAQRPRSTSGATTDRRAAPRGTGGRSARSARRRGPRRGLRRSAPAARRP